MTSRTLTASVFLLFTACGEPPMLKGQVTDLWGNPIEGVKVSLEGVKASPVTDGKGNFVMPHVTGERTFGLSRDGYIDRETTVQITPSEGEDAKVSLKMYPDPTENGFYLVGDNGYEQVTPETVISMGNDLKSFVGIRSDGSFQTEGKEFRVIFHTNAKMDQVMQLGIELHQLTYQKEGEIVGAEGPTSIDVNLWTSAKEYEIRFEPLGSDRNYLILPKDGDLPSGAYAFQTQELLTPTDAESFSRIPQPLRKVYPIQVH